MARPKKQPHERRDASTRADLTLSEKEALRARAALAGMTEAEFVRRRVLGLPVASTPARQDAAQLAALVHEVNRLGVNVNQLARAVHTGRSFTAEWQRLAQECERVLAQVANAYGA